MEMPLNDLVGKHLQLPIRAVTKKDDRHAVGRIRRFDMLSRQQVARTARRIGKMFSRAAPS